MFCKRTVSEELLSNSYCEWVALLSRWSIMEHGCGAVENHKAVGSTLPSRLCSFYSAIQQSILPTQLRWLSDGRENV